MIARAAEEQADAEASYGAVDSSTLGAAHHLGSVKFQSSYPDHSNCPRRQRFLERDPLLLYSDTENTEVGLSFDAPLAL